MRLESACELARDRKARFAQPFTSSDVRPATVGSPRGFEVMPRCLLRARSGSLGVRPSGAVRTRECQYNPVTAAA
jgi:hypothetical protein